MYIETAGELRQRSIENQDGKAMQTGTAGNGTRQAAVYCRVSTADQADRGYSLPTQLEACLARAQREGYTVPDAYVFTEDYPGTSLNRPQFTQVRELVRTQVIHALIVYDLDRLSRKLAHQMLLSDELEQAHVTLHEVIMPTGAKTPETQLMTNVRSVIAEYEREKILERTARGRIGRVKAGFVPGGRRTLGYTYVKHPKKGAHYEVHPEEAALVQRIFQLYVAGGRSQEAIAAQLTREGIPTPGDLRPGLGRTLSARVWHQSTVKNILKNGTYLGTMHYGKTSRLPGKRNPDKKTRHGRIPRSDWVPIPVPPIIDCDTFEAAQAQVQQNAQHSRRNRQHDYLFLGGRLRCGQCGCAMTGEISGHERERYRCGRRSYQDAAAAHTQRSVLASAIEPVVWQAVERVLRDPALIATEIERRRQGTNAQQTDIEQEQHQYRLQLARCEKDLKRWEAAYVGEAIDLDDFKAKKAEIALRRTRLEQELTRLDEQQRLVEQAHLETTSLAENCARVRQTLQRFDRTEQRGALEALNITVTWYPDNPLQIHGSVPVCIASNATQ